MKKHNKKFRAVAVLCITALLFNFLAGCNGADTKGAGDDGLWFHALNRASAEVGSVYTVPAAVARDKGGVQYTAGVKVTDEDGEVELTDDKFQVEKLTDYTVTYSVKIKGRTHKRTTTINVKDTVAPVIEIDPVARVNQGNVITPVYTVTDNSGWYHTSVKVHDTDGGEVASVGGGSFIADKAGAYSIKVTAWDDSGNTAEAYASAMAGYYLIDPPPFVADSETAAGIFTAVEASGDIISGTAGVTEGIREGNYSHRFNSTADNGYPQISFTAAFRADFVKIYDKLTFWVYNGGNKTHSVMGAGDLVGKAGVIGLGPLPSKSWVQVTLTKEHLQLSNARILINNEIEDGSNEAFSFYIDGLRGSFNAETVTIGGTADLSSKLGSIASATGAELTNFHIIDSSGIAVTAGVNADNYTFISEEVGDYTAYVTLSKPNYAALMLGIPVRVSLGELVSPPAYGSDAETAGMLTSLESTMGIAVSIPGQPFKEGTKAQEYAVLQSKAYPSIGFTSAFRADFVKIYDKLTFWVYNGGNNAHDVKGRADLAGKSDIGGLGLLPAKSWVKITLTKEHLQLSNPLLLINSEIGAGNEAFSFYVDGLRGEFDKQTLTIGGTADLSSKLNGIAANVGADLTNFHIKDSSGSAVTAGVNPDNYTFTSDDAGDYTAYVTLIKENYNNLTLEIPIKIEPLHFVTPPVSVPDAEAVQTGMLGYYGTGVTRSIVASIPGTALKEGTQAHRYQVPKDSGDPRISFIGTFSQSFVQVYDKLTFWLYNGGNNPHKVSRNNTISGSLGTLPAKSWMQITLTKADLLTGGPRIHIDNTTGSGNNEAFSFYVDGLRGEFDTVNGTVGGTVNLSAKLNGIAANVGGALADFHIKDAKGIAVTAGVDASAYTFTPAAAGSYTVYVTLVRNGYASLVLEIPVTAA